MGKKRVAVIGDIFDEEIKRKKRSVKREQKAIREGKKIDSEKQTKVDEIKQIEQAKQDLAPEIKKDIDDLDLHKGKKKQQADHGKSAKVAGMKGGERVIDTSSDSIEELKRIRQKEKELEELKARASGETVVKTRSKKIRSSRYKQARNQVTDGKKYSIKDAVALIRKLNLTKFPATLELHINLTKQDAVNNQTVNLPHGIGQEKKVAVVSDALLKKLGEGVIDFDVLVASPKDMPKLVKHAKLLGPRGLMPNPKNGTIVDEPKKAVKSLASDSRLEIKVEKKAPLIHTVVGKLSMKDDQLQENIQSLLNTIGKKFIVRCYLSSTMSPSLRLEL